MTNNKIAIVGMACRFPGGANTLDDYWRILQEGQDVVTEIPAERWGTNFYQHDDRKEPGKSYTFSAGVLSQVDGFDAEFFGISPREAEQMDPQQRLLLELTWEALENGGQLPEQLAGSDCAVYVGIASTDYVHRRVDDLCSIDAYSMTGNTASIASNRISYIFDLQGPSVSVDTACSSALVAVHHACQSIWRGEASMAIAGGVNMLLHPFGFVGFSKASMLSPRGRCRTFDASGDGYVRAEGAAVLFLKPLEQAEADGDPIHAVILATGINCDGRTNGITVPSSERQGQLLKLVYAQAGIDPNDLTYLEAHGTGTAVGDPIETRAIGEVLGKARRSGHPLRIGSAKTNVGHLETASGMAGLVKVVLSMKNNALPRSLHAETLNPNIDFSGHNLEVVTELTHLPPDGKPLLMGVNSFGFGGANAHVLLESFPLLPSKHNDGGDTPATHPPPLCLSARSQVGLEALAKQYADGLQSGNAPAYVDVAWTLLKRRQQLPHGLVVWGNSGQNIVEQLNEYAKSGEAQQVVAGQLIAKPARLALVFSGNGSQWQGMGAVLLQTSAVFRQAVEEVDALFAAHADYSLLDEFTAHPENSRLHLTEIAQPLLFAYQVGVVRILESLGVQAEAAVGHSVGEVAAAWAAGALSLQQAVRVIYERSHAQGKTRGQGRMAAAGLGPEDMEKLLAEQGLLESITIAGVNSPVSVTLSAPLDALEALGRVLEAKGVFYRILDLDYAFHSVYMDPIHDELLEALSGLEPAAMENGIRFVSTVKGHVLSGEVLDSRYWWDNIRAPVRFAGAIDQLLNDGCQIFLEIGPHAILRTYINECLRTRNITGLALGTGRRKQEDLQQIEQAAFSTYLAGCPLDFSVFFAREGKYTPLPNYPWQRERYWYPLTSEGYDLVNRHREHPLLGYRLKDGEALWENQLDAVVVPYLADHVVDGAVIVPGAAYVEMALAASGQWYKTTTHTVENLEIRAPIMLDGEHAKTIHFTLLPADGSFTISSRARLSEDAWTLNVVGRLTGSVLKARPALLELEREKAVAASRVSATEHYRLTEQVGLTYLPAFQGVAEVWTNPAGALARLAIPGSIEEGLEQHLLHPALLDACFQVLVDIFRADLEQGRLAALIPIQIGRLNFYMPDARIAYLQAHIRKQSPRSVVADFLLLDDSGNVIAELERCRFRGVQFARSRAQDPATYVFSPLLMPNPARNAPSAMLGLDMGSLRAAARSYLTGQESSLQRERHFQHILPLFDAMSSALIRETLEALGVQCEQAFALPDLMRANNIRQDLLPLLQRMLEILVEDGLAVQESGLWFLAESSELPAGEDIWLAILGDVPAYLPELTLLGRCGQHLPDVLCERLDAARLLRAEKSSIQEHWRDSSPTYEAMNAALREVLQQLSREWPANERLRILEIGGEAGILAHRLLPVLPVDRCDYVFTDPNEGRVSQAAAEFADAGGFSAMSLELDLSGDNYKKLAANPVDVIIAGAGLYAVADIQAALLRAEGLLKPGGLFILLESAPSRLMDLTAGLEPEWWLTSQGSDGELTAVSRLLKPDEWEALLLEAGFASVETCIEPEDVTGSGVFLMLARTPGQQASHAGQEESLATEDAVLSGAKPWLLLADQAGFSSELAEVLRNHLNEKEIPVYSIFASADVGSQENTRTACVNPARREDFDAALESWTGVEFARVVHLMGLSLDEDTADLLELQDRRCVSTVNLLQALENSGSQMPANLCLVTAGAVTGSGPAEAGFLHLPEQAPLWGLGRVVMNEHPDLSVTLVDLQQTMTAEEAGQLLWHEINHPDGEDEILLSRDSRHVPRMQRQVPVENSAVDTQADVCLDFTAPGLLKNLYWRKLPERALQADEIEIRPRASGLNFRDVMYAMGLLSDEAVENGFAGASLGMELSGTVVRAGSAVTEFTVGDEVIGFAPACFSSRVITRTTAVAHKPADWSFNEAATIPTTFFTVYYALHHLAQLELGEKVLIHGASGGVGLAAIQFARYRGAEIFATAGTDEKREFVRLMGADHVLDSRSLKFADDIMAITNGEGVDIVLNSISGEAINKNLAILKPFGRFLELGKRDFYENSKIGLRPFRNNISYFGIDADQLLIERPALAGRLFREMMDLFREGVLRPLPARVFPAARVEEAFRYMQQSRQIGKVIVSFAEGWPEPVFTETRAPELKLDAAGSYLVTGGLSGFGLQTAYWLADKGAGSLILLGRGGAATDEARDAVENLRSKGVKVAVFACDVADAARLREVLAEVGQNMPALKGVVHAAMVLDDGIVRNLDAARFRKVLAPKMLGAWNLHSLTRSIPLDFFVMYSSATTYLGNPGQANYVAANLYLESLANYRQASGLPATYAAWGAIADAGYLARNDEIKDALQSRLGGAALTTVQALMMLEKLLLSERPGMAVIDFDWSTIQRAMPGARSRKYTEQQKSARGSDQSDQGEDIMALIAGMSAGEVQAFVTELLVDEVGKILRLPRDRIAADKPISALGMDSLMGMELVLAIEDRFGIRLPVMALTEGANIARIAEKIAAQLLASDVQETTATDLHKASITEVAAKHGAQLSEAELEQLAGSLAHE